MTAPAVAYRCLAHLLKARSCNQDVSVRSKRRSDVSCPPRRLWGKCRGSPSLRPSALGAGAAQGSCKQRCAAASVGVAQKIRLIWRNVALKYMGNPGMLWTAACCHSQDIDLAVADRRSVTHTRGGGEPSSYHDPLEHDRQACRKSADLLVRTAPSIPCALRRHDCGPRACCPRAWHLFCGFHAAQQLFRTRV